LELVVSIFGYVFTALLATYAHPLASLRRHQDCRDVEDIVARTFALADGPSGLIVYVGQKAECV
jgi:hypothetical protein